jgi:hypothetical protein
MVRGSTTCPLCHSDSRNVRVLRGGQRIAATDLFDGIFKKSGSLQASMEDRRTHGVRSAADAGQRWRALRLVSIHARGEGPPPRSTRDRTARRAIAAAYSEDLRARAQTEDGECADRA